MCITQFFAWIQLAGKKSVETGELIKVLKFTLKQERELLSRLARTGLIVRLRRGLYLVPKRIPPGGKWVPNEYVIVRELMEDSNALYQIQCCRWTGSLYFYSA